MALRRLFPEMLNAQLKEALAPYYLLSGQDLLLLDEAKQAILNAAKAQGFEEKHEITLNAETQWQALFQQAQSLGLFSAKQIMLLTLPETLSVGLQKNLAELLAMANPDLLFIVLPSKFNKSNEKQAWFTQISEQLVWVNCQTPDFAKLPQWLHYRAKSMSLTLSEEANQLLCYSYEGNLLALKQLLQLLQLHYPDGQISLTRAREVVEQSAQFTPFQWIDALLGGKIKRAERILSHLQSEDIQPVILLGIMRKELLLLLEITRPIATLHRMQKLEMRNLRQEFDRLKIWQSRRGLYQQAASRLTYRQLFQAVHQLAEIERQIKQEFSDQIWQQLERFTTLFK